FFRYDYLSRPCSHTLTHLTTHTGNGLNKNHIMRSIFTFSAILALAIVASAKPVAKAAKKTTTSTTAIGGTAAIEDINNFCFFLPPAPGGDISLSEINAVPFCTQSMANSQNAKIFPDGFITAAHLVKTAKYVQVTGLLDISKYNLSSKDQGGQYDMKAPAGALCHGYTSFVNLVEPSTSDFCIRCCNGDDCPVGRSSAGCWRLVPGDYSATKPVYSVAGSANTTTANTTSKNPAPSASHSSVPPFFTNSPNTGLNAVVNVSSNGNSNASSNANSNASSPSAATPSSSAAGSLTASIFVAAMAVLVSVFAAILPFESAIPT
ncbi:hypothetical protein BC938DRAFT_475223, partial [Jimgerdemannia flammicorona]